MGNHVNLIRFGVMRARESQPIWKGGNVDLVLLAYTDKIIPYYTNNSYDSLSK